MKTSSYRIIPLPVVTVILFLSLSLPGGIQAAVRAADVQSDPIVFYHESAEEPQLSALLAEFDYAAYVSAGLTEFEQMILLKNWVYTHIPYELNFNDSELRSAPLILRRARKGESFLCTNLSAVYLQCAVSLGWTSRHIFLKRPTKEEHAGNDIWSNQYRKWVYIDPTWNIHIERHGIPLSIQEIRREWQKNNGREIVYVFGAGKNMKRYTTRDLPITRNDSRVWMLMPIDGSWLSYSYQIAVLGRNDYFTCGQNGSSLWDPMYVVQYKLSWRQKIKSFFSNGQGYAPRALFYDLNRVDVRVSFEKKKRRKGSVPGTVMVNLSAFGRNNYTPNFMEYLVKINEGDWKVADERFKWKLVPGANILRARIMNRFGVVGPVTVKRYYMYGNNQPRTDDDRVAASANVHKNAVTKLNY
jgi:hypothetical protein